MCRYQHKRGCIKDNALHALVQDPIFHQRIEKNKKGKGSYRRKAKYTKEQAWKAVGKLHKLWCLPTAFLFALDYFCCFSRSRISVSSFSSVVGSAGTFSSSRRSLLINLITMKMAKVTMTKSKIF